MEVSPPEQISPTRHVYTVLSTRFEVPAFYQVKAPVGYGAYGFVVSALDTRNDRLVAIKKNSRIFRDLNDCKRIVREIMLVKHLRHDNIVHLTDFYLPSESDFNDVYMVSDLMDTNLFNVIRTPSQQLEASHLKYFGYQMLRGLKFLHSAGVIHRDLKPANVLVNVACDLQICDFGLARQFTHDAVMTDYVVTRYYRPPEILLMCQKYSFVVDTWSVGCIMMELFTRRILFKGTDYINQLDIILNALQPTEAELGFLESEQATSQVLERLKTLRSAWGPCTTPVTAGIEDPVCADFIMKMLVFDPRKRASPAVLLQHPYLEELHDPNDEPMATEAFQWEYEGEEPEEGQLRSELVRVASEFDSINSNANSPSSAPNTSASPPAPSAN